jgi:hypothetical protein
MTLLVSGSTISIRNSAGTTKFTSDNKLVYQRVFQTGSTTCGASTVWVPFQTLATNDFLVITIKITSGTGQADFIGTIINKEIPANGGVIVDFYGRNVDNQAAADTEVLGVDIIGDNLVFKSIRYTNRGAIGDGTTTVNLQYFARIWSFL